MDEKACTYRVEAAGFDEDRLSLFWGDGVDLVGDCALGDRLLEGFTGSSIFQADIEFCAGFAVCDKPHLRFGFAAEFICDRRGRMDLDGKFFRAV